MLFFNQKLKFYPARGADAMQPDFGPPRAHALHNRPMLRPASLFPRHCEPVTDVTGAAIRILQRAGKRTDCHGNVRTASQ